LFDIGGSTDPVDMPVKDGRSIDEILASIMDGKEDHPEIFETLKNVARDAPESGDVGGAAVVVPPLVVRDFTFTSVSEAV